MACGLCGRDVCFNCWSDIRKDDREVPTGFRLDGSEGLRHLVAKGCRVYRTAGFVSGELNGYKEKQRCANNLFR